MKIKITLMALLAILSTGFVTGLSAKPGGDGSTEIIEVLIDYDNDELTILGSGLSDGVTEPVVTLGGETLTIGSVEDYDAEQIIAKALDLEAYPPGDYLLTVNPFFKSSKSAEMMLTLGAVGPEGPTGPQGETGPAGADGVPGISGYTRVWGRSELNTDIFKWQTAFCPPGMEVLGGGASIGNTDQSDVLSGRIVILGTFPVQYPTVGWRADAACPAANCADWAISPVAICAFVQ